MRSLAVALIAIAATAHADPEADADRAFRDAEQRAAANDPGAGSALETLGASRPITRWTDDAWLEAARLAERGGDFDRARRDLREALAVTADDQLARRAKAALERIEGFAGAGGEWSAVAARHDQLAGRVLAGGDPQPALGELEQLVRDHPGYPRAATAMLVIAQGWEHDGNAERAIAWLRDAKTAARSDADRQRTAAELVRALIRHDALAEAREALAVADPVVASKLRADLEHAETRRAVRHVLWGLLAALAIAATIALRRAAGSWRAAGRRLVRPPAEVIYFVPIAAVLVLIAQTGNPMVARAVRAIAIAGAAVAWLSGAILDGRRGRIGLWRAAAHAVLAAFAVAAAAWLAIDHDRMIDLVLETWRSGPAPR